MTRPTNRTLKQSPTCPRGWPRKVSRTGKLRCCSTPTGWSDVLRDHEPERQRWFAFKDRRVEQRIAEWLAEYEIEPIVEGGTE